MSDRYVFPAYLSCDEDGTVKVKFPDFPDCVAEAEGGNYSSAIVHAREVLGYRVFELKQSKMVIPYPTPAEKLIQEPGQRIVYIEAMHIEDITKASNEEPKNWGCLLIFLLLVGCLILYKMLPYLLMSGLARIARDFGVKGCESVSVGVVWALLLPLFFTRR